MMIQVMPYKIVFIHTRAVIFHNFTSTVSPFPLMSA